MVALQMFHINHYKTNICFLCSVTCHTVTTLLLMDSTLVPSLHTSFPGRYKNKMVDIPEGQRSGKRGKNGILEKVRFSKRRMTSNAGLHHFKKQIKLTQNIKPTVLVRIKMSEIEKNPMVTNTSNNICHFFVSYSEKTIVYNFQKISLYIGYFLLSEIFMSMVQDSF